LAEPPPELPEYLRRVEGLPWELARLAEEGESRRLTRDERRRIDRGIRDACRRVLTARAARDEEREHHGER
jgi:hypothetical protein